MNFIIFVPFFLVFAIIYTTYTLKHLSTQKKFIASSKKTIESQIQRIYDLLPNFIETAKNNCKIEESHVSKIISLRTKLLQSKSLEKKANIHNQLIVEIDIILRQTKTQNCIPEKFELLLSELKQAEKQLMQTCRQLNNTIMDYNISLKVFPNAFIAKWLHYKNENIVRSKTLTA